VTANICTDVTNSRVEDVAVWTMAMAMGSSAAETRPKALENTAALSMVALVTDRAMTDSTNATESEEQSTSNV